MYYDYSQEPNRDIMCIDVTSFYASVECRMRGLNPMTTMLVVMSKAENSGGLCLAASPMAKEKLGITNVTRKYDLPNHPDLIIVPPRMSLYLKFNQKLNDILRNYTSKDFHYIYSIDESFIDVSDSHLLFGTTYDIAKKIRQEIRHTLGLIVKIGIGPNPLLAKVCLDIAAKHNPNFIEQWTYECIPETLWKIDCLTDMWGIGSKLSKKLTHLFAIKTVHDLAFADPFDLKKELGVIGLQLFAHAWGIDRSLLNERTTVKEKSYGKSQILDRDYYKRAEIEIVIREMADQVATTLRQKNLETGCLSLSISYSHLTKERGFSVQRTITPTSNSKTLSNNLILMFRAKDLGDLPIRALSISYSKLSDNYSTQLSLFFPPEKEVAEAQLDTIVDTIRQKFGYSSIVRANALLDGATAINREKLIGGH